MEYFKVPLFKYLFSLSVFWTIVVAGSLGWNYYQQWMYQKNATLEIGRIVLEKDLQYRSWAATASPLYSPVTDFIPPNPYLDIPDREILTPSGVLLTTVNPAYMTRLVYSLWSEAIPVHLTSLNPIRPGNAPDDWERSALQRFAEGESEIFEFIGKGDDTYLRLMRVFLTEKPCLKCHEKQGYKEGDVRGGISILVPMGKMLFGHKQYMKGLGPSHGVIWLFGLIGLFGGGRLLSQKSSEHQQTVTKFIESEKKYRRLVENLETKYFFFSYDLAGNYTFISPSIKTILGFPPGKEPKNYRELLLPETDLKLVEESNRQIRQGQLPGSYRIKVHTYDGTARWIEVIKAPVYDESGKFCGYDGLANDVTNEVLAEKELNALNEGLEQRITERTVELNNALDTLMQSKQRMKLHIEKSQTGFIELGLDFNVKEWNPAAEKIFGYKADEAIGQSLGELVLTEAAAEECKAIWSALLNQKDGHHSINENRTADGRVIVCEWFNTPMTNEKGELFAVASLVHDVTERVESRKHLEEARQMAEEASQNKTEFIANVSHELRTPLNVMGGMLYLFGTSELSLEQKEWLGKTESSYEALTELVEALLDFSSLFEGSSSASLSPLSPVEFSHGLIEKFRSHAKEKGLRISCSADQKLPSQVLADTEKIRKILNVLLSNAVKFTESGGIALDVKLLEKDEFSCKIQFAVEDSGIGIEKENLDKLFSSFTQLDGSSTRAKGGVGLGLSLAKGLTSLLGGSLNVESSFGEGSRFTFENKFQILPTEIGPEHQGSAPPGPNPEEPHKNIVRQIEPEPVRNLLEEMETLLKLADSRTLDVAEKLKPFLVGTILEAEANKLTSLLKNYRFEHALASLDTLKTHFAEILDTQGQFKPKSAKVV